MKKNSSKARRKVDERRCLRCGQCCRDVQLPVSPEEMLAAFRLRNLGNGEQLCMSSPARRQTTYQDIELVYPMLMFKHRDEYPEGARHIRGNSDKRYHYRCKHWSRKEGCAIHHVKPWMCSSFPNGGRSQYKGCGMNIGLPKPEKAKKSMQVNDDIKMGLTLSRSKKGR